MNYPIIWQFISTVLLFLGFIHDAVSDRDDGLGIKIAAFVSIVVLLPLFFILDYCN